MKKFLYSLLVLLMGITNAAFAQQEEGATIESWDGSDFNIEYVRVLKDKNTNRTFEYKAPADGKFYLYNDNHDPISTNVTLELWGGIYDTGKNGYKADASLQDVDDYLPGLGFYAWIEVKKDDIVRFTFVPKKTDPNETKSVIEKLPLKSVFLKNSTTGGNNTTNAIKLTQDVELGLPECKNTANGSATGIYSNNVAYCSFEAPYTGIASISTMEYEIYHCLKGVSKFTAVQSNGMNDDHLIPVEGGKTYYVAIPRTEGSKIPTEVTFKMAYDRSNGACAEYPINITKFPVTIDLVKGDNFYAFNTELLGKKTMMEVAVKEGWKGSIEYWESANAESTSTALTTDVVSNASTTFYKNIDLEFVHCSGTLIVNFKSEKALTGAASLTLDEPADGEAYSTATEINFGDNEFNGPARDYWFKYTAQKDAEYIFSATGKTKIKYVCFDAYSEMTGEKFRVDEGETIYVCITKSNTDEATLSVECTEILPGDYCDKAIKFNLGENITFTSRGISHYNMFVPKEDGFAIVVSTGWSIQFREECDGHPLNPSETRNEISLNGNPGDDDYEYVMEYTYKFPVTAGKNYIVEVQTTKESLGEEITITTKYETPVEGDFCSTAIAITTFEEKINLAYENEITKWYKFTADKTGFYTIKAKLGHGGSLTAELGTQIINSDDDRESSESPETAGFYGYKIIKQWVEEDQVVYICTKTGNPDYESSSSAEYYFSVSFSGLREGEEANNAAIAKPNTNYPVMSSNPESPDYDANAYNKWYTYTIPAGKSAIISILSEAKNYYGLTFKKEDLSSMYQAYGDFVQKDQMDANDTRIGRSYEFTATDADRTFYIQAPVVTYATAVYWKIEIQGDDNTGDDNTGDDNTGDDNTGDDNTGDDNTGDDNTGDDNTGDDNTGDDNTGDDNTGDDNTGDDNTGDDNTGDDNTGDSEEEDNAVDFVEITDNNDVIYDLMGRRVLKATKGIYIVNGVKRVIK